MAFHSDETENHVPYAYSYADAAARTGATGLAPADVGKLARQLDDNSLWMLTDDSPVTWQAVGGAGGSAPANATYVTQTASGGLSAEQALSSLSTGLVKVTTGTGVLSTAVAGTDYQAAVASVVTGLTINMGDGTNVITSSEPFVLVKVPFAATVTAWEMVADASGDIVVTVSRAPTATPTTFTEISGSSDPTLSAAQTNKDTAISGDWSDVTLDADDWLKFQVSGTPATVKRVGLALTLTRTL